MSQQFSTQRRQEPQRTQSKKEARRVRYAAINATWKQLRPDLHHSAEELREARLDFAAKVLGCGPIGSLGDLTLPQLDRVIEAMKRDFVQPALPVQGSEFNVQSSRFGQGSTRNPELGTPNGVVVHLASDEQVWMIALIFDYLGWTDNGREGFLRKNFRRTNARMLLPRQSGAAITILLRIAASADIKKREGSDTKVSEGMVHRETPALKKRIGIAKSQRSEVRDQKSEVDVPRETLR